MELLKQVIIRRYGITVQEADDLITEAKEEILRGANPEEVLYDYFGLELDYVFDIL